ncbi:MAG: spore coat associated protein CotJA [Firmicutes bacterium]|nr:spore coat associated protein CotJA [Bacillota bacterium]
MNYYPDHSYEDRAVKIRVSGPLAMAYVPMQKFTNLYGAAEGFRRGTLFKELDLPFKGGKSK